MRLMTIDAIDIESSFEPDGAGRKIKRILDKYEKPILNQSIWEIGRDVYEALQSDDRPDVLENYREGLVIAEMLVKDFVRPMFVEMIERGLLTFSASNEGYSITQWDDQTLEAKIINGLEIIEKRIGHISLFPPDMPDVFSHVIASLILLKIDDAAISEFLDGRGLIENVEDIYTLYRHLSAPPYVKAIQQHALRTRARAGAESTNSKHKTHQDAVFDWLDTNYRPGYKHADMAAEIEKLVPREYDTILKDITAWKRPQKEKRKR